MIGFPFFQDSMDSMDWLEAETRETTFFYMCFLFFFTQIKTIGQVPTSFESEIFFPIHLFGCQVHLKAAGNIKKCRQSPSSSGLRLQLMLTVEENQQLRVVHLQHHSYHHHFPSKKLMKLGVGPWLSSTQNIMAGLSYLESNSHLMFCKYIYVY